MFWCAWQTAIFFPHFISNEKCIFFKDREWVLDAILNAAEPAQVLNMLGSLDIAPIAADLRAAIGRNRPAHPLPRLTVIFHLAHLFMEIINMFNVILFFTILYLH